MDITKQLGPVQLEIVSSVAASGLPQVALKASVAAQLGGGAAAGIVGFKNTTEIDVGAGQAVDLIDGLAKAHFPQFGVEIDSLCALLKSKLASI